MCTHPNALLTKHENVPCCATKAAHIKKPMACPSSVPDPSPTEHIKGWPKAKASSARTRNHRTPPHISLTPTADVQFREQITQQVVRGCVGRHRRLMTHIVLHCDVSTGASVTHLFVTCCYQVSHTGHLTIIILVFLKQEVTIFGQMGEVWEQLV